MVHLQLLTKLLTQLVQAVMVHMEVVHMVVVHRELQLALMEVEVVARQHMVAALLLRMEAVHMVTAQHPQHQQQLKIVIQVHGVQQDHLDHRGVVVQALVDLLGVVKHHLAFLNCMVLRYSYQSSRSRYY